MTDATEKNTPNPTPYDNHEGCIPSANQTIALRVRGNENSGMPEKLSGLPELVSTGDIARMAGISIQAVGNWKARYSDTTITNTPNPNDMPMFPRPIVKTGAGPLYSKAEIEKWLLMRAERQT